MKEFVYIMLLVHFFSCAITYLHFLIWTYVFHFFVFKFCTCYYLYDFLCQNMLPHVLFLRLHILCQTLLISEWYSSPLHFSFFLFTWILQACLTSMGYLSWIIQSFSLFLLSQFFSMFCSLQRSSIQTQTKMILRLKRSFKKFQWHTRFTLVVVFPEVYFRWSYDEWTESLFLDICSPSFGNCIRFWRTRKSVNSMIRYYMFLDIFFGSFEHFYCHYCIGINCR